MSVTGSVPCANQRPIPDRQHISVDVALEMRLQKLEIKPMGCIAVVEKRLILRFAVMEADAHEGFF